MIHVILRIQHVILQIQHVLLRIQHVILRIQHVMITQARVMCYCNVAKHKWDTRCKWTCGEEHHNCSVMHAMLSWLPSGQNLEVACQTCCTGALCTLSLHTASLCIWQYASGEVYGVQSKVAEGAYRFLSSSCAIVVSKLLEMADAGIGNLNNPLHHKAALCVCTVH